MTSLVEAFREYQRFYVQEYLPSMIADDPEELLAGYEMYGWADPLGGLRTLTDDEVAALVSRVGPLPAAYVELVTTVGVGPLVAASEDEPSTFTILAPDEIETATKTAMSWLSAKDAELARNKLGLDPEKLLPILCDEGKGFYVMLTRRDAEDDHVVLFDHGYESGHPFPKPKPFAAFVSRWITCARELAPLEPFTGL